MFDVRFVQHFPIGDGVVVARLITLAEFIYEATLRIPSEKARIVVGNFL